MESDDHRDGRHVSHTSHNLLLLCPPAHSEHGEDAQAGWVGQWVCQINQIMKHGNPCVYM